MNGCFAVMNREEIKLMCMKSLRLGVKRSFVNFGHINSIRRPSEILREN